MPVGCRRRPGVGGSEPLPCPGAVYLEDTGTVSDSERPHDGLAIAEAVFLAREQDGTEAAPAPGGGD